MYKLEFKYTLMVGSYVQLVFNVCAKAYSMPVGSYMFTLFPWLVAIACFRTSDLHIATYIAASLLLISNCLYNI